MIAQAMNYQGHDGSLPWSSESTRMYENLGVGGERRNEPSN